MCSVDAEGKWKWYLKVEYGVLTIYHYLNLGTSLGAVQTRHSMTAGKLRWRYAKKRWAALRRRAGLRLSHSASCHSGCSSDDSAVASEDEAGEPYGPHEASVRRFEAKLRRLLERGERQAAHPSGSSGSGASTADAPIVDVDGRFQSPVVPTRSFEGAGSVMEECWEEIHEEEAEAVNGTWDSAEVLARWNKQQLLRYYLRLCERRQVSRGYKRFRQQQHQQQQQAKSKENETDGAAESLVGSDATAASSTSAVRPLVLPRAGPATSISAIPLVELEREFLTQILNEFGDCVNVTHAEAVDMRLLKLFVQQALALRAHKTSRTAEEDGDSGEQPAALPDEDNEDNVFILANTDATYAACKREGRPTAVTYGDAVRLTTLLGEAIAWESFRLHTSNQARLEALALDASASNAEGGSAGGGGGSRSHRQQTARASVTAVAGATGPGYSGTLKSVGGVKTAVQADCIALMLPNSVEYNLLWWGISRSGPLKTLLTDLYDGPAFTENIAEKQRLQEEQEAALSTRNVLVRTAIRAKRALLPVRNGGGVAAAEAPKSPSRAAAAAAAARPDPATAVYRPCRTALINTNLSSNAMLYHALSCSGCLAIILDVQFVPLLFVSSADEESPQHSQTSRSNGSGAEAPATLRIHVPPQVQRVFVWRWNGAFTAAFTPEMKSLLDQFNAAAFEFLPEALSASAKHGAAGAGAQHLAPRADPATAEPSKDLATPALDLFDLVKDEYEQLSAEEALDIASDAAAAREGRRCSGNQNGKGRRCATKRGMKEKMRKGVPSRFPLLLKRMLAHPPRWLHCDPALWTPHSTPTAAGGRSASNNSGHQAPNGGSRPTGTLSPTVSSLHSGGSAGDTGGTQRTTVAHSLFAQLYIRSIRESMSKTRTLAAREAAATAMPSSSTAATTGAVSASNEPTALTPEEQRQQQQHNANVAEARKAARARAHARLAVLDKLLVEQQRAFNKRMAAALSRFTHLQPVLFIYTSGTTGLPKAARFSHLRFFATSFLSQTLRYREKTREVLEHTREAQGRFHRALKAAAVKAQAEVVKNGGTEAQGAPLMTAFVDEETRVKTTSVRSVLNVWKGYFVGVCTFLLWVLGLLFYVRRMRFVVSRFLHVVTCRRSRWLEKYEQEAAIAEEASRVSIYNCLPMYHTVGCVFCLGHLMHALEEQQAAQEDLARQLAWHGVTKGRAQQPAWGSVPYEPTRLPTARMIIRSKFSASKFVPDMQHYHITVVQYIGEILRYAVLFERDHAPSAPQVEHLLQEQLALTLAGSAAKVSDTATSVIEDANSTTPPSKNGETAAAVTGIAESNNNNNSSSSSNNNNNNNAAAALIMRRVLPALGSEKDTLHVVNLFSRWIVPYAFGNGLRKDIWFEVKDRLSVAQPVEFYSSTEGNIFLFNLFDIPGAVGHIPRFPGYLNWMFDMNYFPIFPFRVLKYDEDTQQIWRDPKTQYGKIVQVDEPGEAVGEIIEGYDMFALRRFDGYHQEQPADIASLLTAKNSCKGGSNGNGGEAGSATVINVGDVESKKKIVRHIMWPYKKDAYFRSGDLVKFDDFGFVSFVDRVGETFRWKGENVSTLEVSNALSTVHTKTVGVQEAVVYGVTIPGREGRAGMALLTLHRRFLDSEAEGQAGAAVHRRPTLQEERLFLQNDLYAFLCGRRRCNGDGTLSQSALPPYATPVFIRVQDATDEAEGGDHDHTADAPPASERNPKETVGKDGAPGDRDDSVRTTTFKYRKTVLTRQGYSQVPPSTIENVEAWGEEGQPQEGAEAGGHQGDTQTRPSSRFYVLITKPDVWMKLARNPKEAAEVRAGYVPLTAATVDLVGERLAGCGW